MFETCVSHAWAEMLKRRASESWCAEMFGLWPCTDLSHKELDLWTILDDWVIDILIKQKAMVWSASTGCCVSIEHAFFAEADAENLRLSSLMPKINFPAVMLKGSLIAKVQERAGHLGKRLEYMTPKSVGHHLCQSKVMIPAEAAPSLLEYCLLDAIRNKATYAERLALCHDALDVQFWPTMDGSLSACAEGMLLPRDMQEMQLFSGSRKSATLDLRKIKPNVVKLLDGLANPTTKIRHRSLDDLGTDWPIIYPHTCASGDCEVLPRPAAADPKIVDIWVWITARFETDEQRLPESMTNLWLLPINNHRIRRLISVGNTAPALLLQGDEPLSNLLMIMTKQDFQTVPPLVDSQLLPPGAFNILREQAKHMPVMSLATLDQLGGLMDWLVGAKARLITLDGEQRNQLLKYLEKLIRDMSFERIPVLNIADPMRQLPLFSKSICPAPFK